MDALLLINNEPTPASNGRTFERHDPLTGALVTRAAAATLQDAQAAADTAASGICHINGPTVQDEAQTPFGGMKASGYGRFNGLAAINEFTELRWITVETEPHHYPF
jgi:acyl-CoA reductase-like NAD-dependent aldehyde dehydrogenase